MKKLLVRYNIWMVLLLLANLALAGNYEEKRKKINKTYNLQESTVFAVSNEFGDIEINTWDKSVLQVDVEILVNGRSDSRAQELLDKIQVVIDESSSVISFETDYSANMNTKNDESFEVNYKVSLPATNEIRVENKFGDIYIGKRLGISYVELSYGNLKTDDMGESLKLNLSFGKGDIGKTKQSKIEVKYSELEMGDAERMEMEQQFSDVTLGKVGTLILESKYGNMEIETVDDIKCNVQFSGFDIGLVNKRLEMEANYVSDFQLDLLSKDFEIFKFYGKFSTVEINLEPGTKADLDAELSFANLSGSYDDMEFYYKAKDDNRSEYKARVGGGNSDKRIIVKSSYGDLKIH